MAIDLLGSSMAALIATVIHLLSHMLDFQSLENNKFSYLSA